MTSKAKRKRNGPIFKGKGVFREPGFQYPVLQLQPINGDSLMIGNEESLILPVETAYARHVRERHEQYKFLGDFLWPSRITYHGA